MPNKTGEPAGNVSGESPGTGLPPGGPATRNYPPGPAPYGNPPTQGWYYPYPAPVLRPRPSRFPLVLGLVAAIFLVLFIGALAWLITMGGETTIPLKTETETVPQGSASTVTVTLNKGIGDLRVAGGATDLMNATFQYNVEKWKPNVNYNVNGSAGSISVSQPSTNWIGFGNYRNDWNVLLNNNVPLNMKVDTGVGKAELILAGLNLRQLEVNSGVGDSRIDLTGISSQSANVTIKAGVGKTTLLLPDNIGVRVVTNKGLGSIHATNLVVTNNIYTNSAYGNTPATVDVVINVGVGDIYLQNGR
ncbi:MAG TPA: toast rack family protein [Chloroflexia bacterium]|nr:toast rack family protein [Chloroflexia bacterium]